MACMLLSTSVCDNMRNWIQIEDDYMKYVNDAEDVKCCDMYVAKINVGDLDVKICIRTMLNADCLYIIHV